jgi:hypothetical protein
MPFGNASSCYWVCLFLNWMNMAMAINMEGAPVTNDTITECSGGDEGR